MDEDLSDRPIEVAALPGAVVILAPQGATALTPWAALESAFRLVQAAQTAIREGQPPCGGD